MKWPWRKHHRNGEVAAAAADAARQLQQAHDRDADVDRTARAAEALTRRTDRFTAEVERSWHLRGSA